MKEIKLSKGKVALVDDEDYEYLNQYRWYAEKVICCKVPKYYARREIRLTDGTKTKIMMHNVILGFKGVDHKDGNSLNNQKENLRSATNSQNNTNRIVKKITQTGFRGCEKNKKGFLAKISFEGKRHYLGYFKNLIDAARAYNEKASELHGEFAVLNVIPEQL